MKFKIILSIIIGFTLTGCSLDEIEEQEIQAVSLKGTLGIQETHVGVDQAVSFYVELRNTIKASLDNACGGEAVQGIRIRWTNPFITNDEKNIVRNRFEHDHGKHPLTGIDADGIHEYWVFSGYQVDTASRSVYDPCADDVIRPAIVNEEEIELDD